MERWPQRIRAERKARLWDVHSMARRLRDAAGENGRDLPDHEALVRSIRRWESGRITILSERYRLLFCRSFGLDENDLFSASAALPAPRPPDAGHDLEAMSSLRGADRRVGGGHLYATVIAYLQRDVAPRLFGGSDGATAFVAAAAFTEMAGWMAHDAGQDASADHHFSRALDLAVVGKDRQLEAHILGSKSHLARHLGHPNEAVRLARQGVAMLADTGTAAPSMEARLLALGARGVAALGDSAECSRLLLNAEDALGRQAETSPWTGPFDESTLALNAAQAMLALGDGVSARNQANQAISLRTGDRTRSRALARLVLAEALIIDGQASVACPHVLKVIEETRSLSSLVVTRHLADLRESLTAYREQEVVADSLRALGSALRERRWLYQWGGPHLGAAVQT